jgi:hypothetical protein
MGGHVAAFRGKSVALFPEHLAVRPGEERAKGMVAVFARAPRVSVPSGL